jgi:polar amino acid transport system substrate-binding protein
MIRFLQDEDVLDSLFAIKIEGFLYDEVTLHYYAENKYRDEIAQHPTTLKSLTIAFAMPKNSPLRKPVNVALLKIMEEPA